MFVVVCFVGVGGCGLLFFVVTFVSCFGVCVACWGLVWVGLLFVGWGWLLCLGWCVLVFCCFVNLGFGLGGLVFGVGWGWLGGWDLVFVCCLFWVGMLCVLFLIHF